jgi:uncharacterized protein DUF5996
MSVDHRLPDRDAAADPEWRASEGLPELHLVDWRPTKDTLHLYAQIVGKIRLGIAPPQNHWWNATLYADIRSLTTRRLHHKGTTFAIGIDLVGGALVVQTADGRSRSFELGDGWPVAEFDRSLHDVLRELGIDVEIKEDPYGLAWDSTPFPIDVEHASWDADAVQRFARILDWTDSVFTEFSGWFNGKTSPVHLFWHSFDLAVTRFSGRPGLVVEHPVDREAYSHEVISFGFWPGDDNVPDAHYYSYTAPEPDGLREQPLTVGGWVDSGSGSLALLPYESVRTASRPRETLLSFLESAYEAGARLAGWDTSAFESRWCPTREQLKELHETALSEFGRPVVGL